MEATGHNCSGLYGRWHVRVRVRGAASGSAKTAFVLRRGKETAVPLSFRVQVGPLSPRVRGTLQVSARRGALVLRGRVGINLPFRSVSRPVTAKIPLQRGPTAACG